MIPLPRESCIMAVCRDAPTFEGAVLLQEGMGKDAWRVTVASVLLCRARSVQVKPVLQRLLRVWPEPMYLARADVAHLEDVVRPCGFHRNRARQLQRLSTMWFGQGWTDLRNLPGVGVYVTDAVGLLCFGCLDLESNDHALKAYADFRRRELLVGR